MKCRKVKEELVLLISGDDDRNLTVAIRRHVSICPHCAERSARTRKVVTIVRERCRRQRAPMSLRDRILSRLQSPPSDS